MELDGVLLSLSRDELAAVTDLADRLRSPRAVQDRALAVARQKAHGRDARYVLALYQLEIARQRKDDALRAEALDALIASGLVSGERLAADLEERGGIAFQQHDYARAGALWSRELQLKPNDANLLSNLAQVRQAQGDAAGAADLLQRSAASRAASGRKPTEILARQMLSTAYNAHLLKPTADAALALVAAYPSADNWRLSLLAYRQLGAPAGEFEIDLLRLMRATFSLTRPEEYQRLAQLLEHSGRPTEGRAVLEEGISRQLLDPGQPTIRDILAELDRFIPQERARLAKPNLVMQTLAAANSLGAFGRHAEAIALLSRTARQTRYRCSPGQCSSRHGAACGRPTGGSGVALPLRGRRSGGGPARALCRSGRLLDCSAHSAVAGARGRQTLKRNSITSPSWTT